MEQLVQQINGAEWQYAWLPTSAVQALVCWLAATILRPAGKFAQAIPYLSQGQQAIDEELRRHHIGVQVATLACTLLLATLPPVEGNVVSNANER